MLVEWLALAKRKLLSGPYSLVVVKDRKPVFVGNRKGLIDLINVIDTFFPLVDAAVADRVVGRAAALLLLYARASAVYAHVLTKPALRLLYGTSTYLEFGTLVEALARYCPFEQAVQNVTDPEEAYRRLRALAYRTA